VESGAQPGNDNATKGALFNSALKRALARAGKNVDGGLNTVCDLLVKAAGNGEQWAIKEIADRIDGRPHQSTSNETSLSIEQPTEINLTNL
jgi:hypothetical protein